MVTIDDICRAKEAVGPFIHRTPLIHSRSLSEMSGADVYLKLENLQKTGSFKVRGAFNKLLGTKGERVIAASMGNHAQAVAYAAHRMGKKATIVMPETAPIVKQEATRGYRADVILKGERFSEALEFALSERDATFIHPFDDETIISGQGTAGLEIAEDLKDIDAVIVPVGGGGLISGIAVAVKQVAARTLIIGVQSGAAPSACLSFREGRIVSQEPAATIADGIAIGRVGLITFEHVKRYVDDMVMVDEDGIALAILLLLERKKLVVEGAGAVVLAALLAQKEKFRGKRVVLVMSGGNVDFTLIDRIIMKGLVSGGRIVVFEVLLDDVAGSLAAVSSVMASMRANIIGVGHDRFAGDVPVGKARVVFTVEVRGRDHLEELIASLEKCGYRIAERK